MSNNEADRLAEQIKDAMHASLMNDKVEAKMAAAVDQLAALAKQQAHEATAEPAAVPVAATQTTLMDTLTPELEKAFQDGFIAELHKPAKHRTMTAEVAGLRAMARLANKTQAAQATQAEPMGDAKCDWHATFSSECEHCATALSEAPK